MSDFGYPRMRMYMRMSCVHNLWMRMHMLMSRVLICDVDVDVDVDADIKI